MLAILAEGDSDYETLKVICQRVLGVGRMRVRGKGLGSCGKIRSTGARHVDAYRKQGATHFVICHDADGRDPHQIRQTLLREVVGPSGLSDQVCVVVPVQEIEAWLIADESAVSGVLPLVTFPAVHQPEIIDEPKEWLRAQSRAKKSRPPYEPTVHNQRVAERLSIDLVARKCPSFVHFLNFLRSL